MSDTTPRDKTCCFFGHRKIDETEQLKKALCEIIENLITNENVDTFLFGSRSQFNNLCLEAITGMMEKYPHIKRIYVRAEFQYINDDYMDYLLESYDDTYFPERVQGAGRASYVMRNREMIDKSKFCVVYYDTDYIPTKGKSGTAVAYEYALKKKIINLS